MKKKSVLSTLGFILFTIVVLVLIFSAVLVTILNTYKPTVKAYVDDKFIGYFSSEQQFDDVYNSLVTEKKSTSSNVKVYLENEPTFETCYIKDSLLTKQNVYTNLRAEIKTEYTFYDVNVDGENKMRFDTQDDAQKYADNLKNEVAKLNVEVKEEKVAEQAEVTTIERADSILKDIVDRNKPVETPKATVQTTNNYVNTTTTTTNQRASQELANIAAAQGGVWPTVERRINCHYMGYAGHTGTDIGGAVGTPIYAYKSGVVIFAGWGSGYGLHVKIDHGNGIVTYYAHCSQLFVTAGQQVSQGEQIAKIGMTGYTTGPHLHFEIRVNGVPINAYPYIAGK